MLGRRKLHPSRRLALKIGIVPFGAVFMLGAASAKAQTVQGGPDASPASKVAASSSNAAAQPVATFNEVIVTAQRRGESLQKVPISVTAISSTTLSNAHVTNVEGLQQVTPGLTFSEANRSALPYIRGIGSPDISVGSESSVAIYVDGVYVADSNSAMLQLNNVSRIEVDKGPQGTLFGRNATAGLIQILTKDPSPTPSGNFEIGYGDYNTVSGSAYLAGPIADHVSADIAAVVTDQQSGWGRNVYLDRPIDKNEVGSVRSKWLFDFGDTKFTLAADYTSQRTDIGSERNLFPGSVGKGGAQPLPGFYDSQSNIFPVGTLNAGGVSLHAEHAFDAVTLTSITSYRQTRFTSLLDVDETPLNFENLRYLTEPSDVTQEFQLTSTERTPLSWIVGLFYMHRSGDQPVFVASGSALGFPPFNGGLKIDAQVTSEVVAPYAQATLRILPETDLTGGIRYTVEDQHFTATESNLSDVNLTSVNKSIEYKDPTWRVALNHNFSSDLMGYASYNRGFKSGVYNVTSPTAPPAAPETIDAYEIGFKTAFFDRLLRLNAAAFDYEYNNIQLAAPSVLGVQTINAARAEITGLDGSIDAAPIRGLTLSIGGSYLPKAEYTSFPSAPLYTPNPAGGAVQSVFNDSGGRMIRAPKFTGTLSANYTFAVGDGDVAMGMNYHYTSRFLWNIDGVRQQSAYSLVDGQAKYTWRAGYSAALWAKNIFDQKYMSGVSETTSDDVYSPGAPRTVGVSLGYHF